MRWECAIDDVDNDVDDGEFRGVIVNGVKFNSSVGKLINENISSTQELS